MKPERPDFTLRSTTIKALAETAARWVARREAGLTPVEREQLRLWLAADAAHKTAFAQADRRRTELDWPLHAGVTDEILGGLEQRARGRRHRRLVATGAMAALLVVGFVWQGLRRAPVLAVPAIATGIVVMQPERRTLPDGSIVELKDGAEITVDFSEAFRRVALVRGEAHFSVAKNPARPFIVRANGVEVRAVGTAFAVQLGQAAVEVLVTEGKVAVEKSSPVASPVSGAQLLASLSAGHRVVVETHATTLLPDVLTVSAAEADERLAWRVPRLEFSGTPLAEVIALFNRHNRVQFVLADSALGRLQLSGVLRADRVDVLVAMLETDFAVRTERKERQIVLHR